MYQLEDMVPAEVPWDVTDKVGREMVLTFRPFTVGDEAWLKREYGNKLQEVFEKFKIDEICRIAFHQLNKESKKVLFEIKFVDIDEDGEEVELKLNGPNRVAMLVGGFKDQADLVKKLIETRGLSLPIIEEIGKTLGQQVEEEAKKKTS